MRCSRRCRRPGMPLLVHGEVTDPEVDVFDRETVFLERTLAVAREALPDAQDRARAHHHARGGGVRRARAAPTSRRRSPRITCCSTATRSSPGGIQPASLLPAGAQARDASPRAGEGRDLRQSEVLPRHRQRAALARQQGDRRAGTRASTPRTPRSSSTRKRSRPPARSTSSRRSRATSARTSTGCRATRAR